MALVAAVAMAGAALPAFAKDLPDLIVERIALRATGDCSGRGPLITGEVVVKNTGRGRGQIFTTRDMVRIEVKGRRQLSRGFKFVNSMAPGQAQRVPARIGQGLGPHRPGTLNIDVTVDPRKVFEESNEGNNRATASVTITCR